MKLQSCYTESIDTLKGDPLCAGFFMDACYTWQIAIGESGRWVREYVCAIDEGDAINQFMREHPEFDIDRLAHAHTVELSCCT